MAITNWQSTRLFKHLNGLKKGKPAESMIALLKNPQVMDKIEKILSKGGSTPKDFTLHDEEHSFRVAEKMWELIPISTQKKLSAYELGLLLLSAYLHDIGMSPEFKNVEAHKEYLTTNVKKGLTEDEIREFQKWIDNDPRSLSIDIRKEKVEDPKIANYILPYYIRHKHNDWSGEWIKSNLDKISLEHYPFWVDDLIKICKSHHYGIDVLKGEGFDPKPVGSNSKVHIRYLAMCLRVADVMENDPERTPEVILQHRDISSDSVTYWLKDHRFSLVRNQNRFTIYARPEKAFLHKAIEETAQYIENELRLCSELIEIKPLVKPTTGDLKEYEWIIEPYLHRDIIPKDNLYEYIQGAFRPNTSKLLELLGGNQLYGDTIWAYRELIQNAFDAIKERMAYVIINEDKDPQEYLAKLGDLYSIDILLEEREDGVWLVCRDQGVGMTKSIIEKFFLESGSSKRHEISELERKCKEKGFNFGRTGQFGIGVLSYFMIAEKIIVKTKREFNTGYRDEESIAWQFEINGTHDFGELSKYNKNISGTEIALKLKPEVTNSIASWDDRFSEFLKDEISKTPCNLNYISEISSQKQRIKFGWTNLVEDVSRKVSDGFSENTVKRDHSIDGYMPSFRINEQLRYDILAKEVISEMRKNIDFLFEEGEIEGIGMCRIYIPYFKLNKGNSFYYLKEDVQGDVHKILRINKGYFWKPDFEEINFSLKGIKIKEVRIKDFENNPFRHKEKIRLFISNAHVEIDFASVQESCLSVSRHALLLETSFSSFEENIKTRIKNLLNKHKSLFDNCYGSLNYFVNQSSPANEYWGFKGDQSIENGEIKSLKWEKVQFPVCSFGSAISKRPEFKYQKKALPNLVKLNGFNGGHSVDWFRSIEGNYRIGIVNNGLYPFLFPILVSKEDRTVKYKHIFKKIKFPEQWENIIFIGINYKFDLEDSYINERSKYFKLYDVSILAQIVTNEKTVAENDLVDEKHCFAFLLNSIMKYQDEFWIGLCEKRKTVIQHVFNRLKNDVYYILVGSNLIKISNNKWEKIEGEEKKKILPEITDEEYIVKRNQ